ncbi:hypothetical protein H0H92_011058, partial [Tricholoma furcatifolium]
MTPPLAVPCLLCHITTHNNDKEMDVNAPLPPAGPSAGPKGTGTSVNTHTSIVHTLASAVAHVSPEAHILK